MIEVNGRKIGPGESPFIIAEVSCNHMGSLEQAKKLIEAAKDIGADAAKLQTYTADTLTMDAPQDHFKIDHPLWNNMTLHDLYLKAQTPFEWMKELFDYGRDIGITVFSAPFDLTAAQLLIDLDVPMFKIASFEAVHIPLIKKVASSGKPLIISTGLANEDEIEEALTAARGAGAKDIILLHCISAYPTPIEQANLRTIEMLRDRFDVMVGLSDHTTDTLASELAVGLGACVIEKHIMLHEDDDTFDKAFSLIPEQFEELIQKCRAQNPDHFQEQLKSDPRAEKALGQAGFKLKDNEKESCFFRPSIMVSKDIKAGEIFSEDNLIIRRPNAGLAPKYWGELIGQTASCALERGDALGWDAVADHSKIRKA